jgi:hypothetical protein
MYTEYREGFFRMRMPKNSPEENPSPPGRAFFLAAAAGIVGTLAIWFLFFRKKDEQPTQKGLPPAGGTSGSSSGGGGGGGSSGSSLSPADQSRLTSLGYAPVAASVLQFQQDFNTVNTKLLQMHLAPISNMSIAQDGIIGPQTREALDATIQRMNETGQVWLSLVSSANA